MKLTKYNNYKNTNIHWLGDIPEHWEVKRIKDVSELRSGDNFTANEFEEDGIYSVYGGNGFRGKTNRFTNNGNYILIGRQGALCGNINYVHGKFWATEHAVVVYISKKTNMKWYGEMLRVMNLNQYSLASAQPGLSVEKIKRLSFPTPPLSEQTAIANYLDQKTAQIDKKVDLLSQKIEKYKELKKSLINETVCRGLDKNVKLKPSGIDWIGDIPEHWEVKRVKHFAFTIKGRNLDFFDTQITDSLPNLSLDYLRNDSVVHPIYVRSRDKAQLVSENDFIIVWDGAGVGEILKGKKGYLSSTIAKIKFNEKLINPLFFYFFRDGIDYTLKRNPSGMGIPHLNPTVFVNYPCPFPPLQEQTAIAQYLDEKTNKIDQITTNLNQQIVALKELRKTLINEVVTGKVRVID